MNYLGIDIGGTNIAFGIVDSNNEIIYSNSFKTKSFANAKQCCKAIYDDLNENSHLKIQAIGIGAPSVNYITQQIEYAPNLEWEDDIIPLKEIFENQFEITTKIINDSNAAALGEHIYGAAKDMDTFAMVTLGTGVGIGLVINGEIYNGANGTGGEFGHVCIDRVNGRECGCGNYGCLETYIGKDGILKTARQKIEFGGVTQLNKIIPSELSAKDIFKFARKEDPVAVEIVAQITRDLGYAISILANSLDISNIFLFGGIAKEGNFIKKRTLKDLKPHLTSQLRQNINLQTSALIDENPAILGAAHLVKI